MTAEVVVEWDYFEEGFPIGSGTVESGCKQFKARLTGPGMQWARASEGW